MMAFRKVSGFFFLQAVNAGEASLGRTGQVFVSLLVAFAPPGASARGAGPKRLPHSLFPLTLIVGTVNIGFVTFYTVRTVVWELV